jgi:hypothetical protein
MSSESANSKPTADFETADIGGMSASQLDELVHVLTARRLVEALRAKPTPGEPSLAHDPRILQVALRFLADNGVTGKDIPSTLIEEVQKKYQDKAPFKLAQ